MFCIRIPFLNKEYIMINDKLSVSATHIRYLIAMKELDSKDGIRSSDIAYKLRLSRPTVHSMMDTFLGMEYIVKKTGGQIFLTKYGADTAGYYDKLFCGVKQQLFGEIQEDQSVDRGICALIAELSQPCREHLERLAE